MQSSTRRLLLRTLSNRGWPSPPQRWFSRSLSSSSSSSYSIYEYPNAEEPPEITRTQASDVRDRLPPAEARARLPHDPFDDTRTLSPDQVDQIRRTTELNTQLGPATTEITPAVPAHIPPLVPRDELEVPQTIVTTLDNGVRVVTQETHGQVSTVGVVSDLGSRTEQPSEVGVTNLLEVLAFGATQKYSGTQVTTLLQDWGGQRFVSTGREQSLHCIDLLRPNVGNAMEMLQQVLLEPKFLPEEVMEAKMAVEFLAMEMDPQMLLSEALQQAAYGADQQLGQPHLCPPEALPHLTIPLIHDYWQRQFVQNPQGLVIGGAGVTHDYLVEQSDRLFGHLQQERKPDLVKPSQYRGGETRLVQDSHDGLVRIGVGVEVGGWHADEIVPACVLQTLLGGGASFSAGGPGKGMYSRLYRQILNQYGWAESAEAFTSFHAESGLFGIAGSTQPRFARAMVQTFVQHLCQLAVEPVSDIELDRARNMLKCNVLIQLESRLVLLEDMTRQVLTYGQRETMDVTCVKIDAVTKEDLRQVAIQALQRPLTIAAVGPDLSHVPRHDEIMQWLR